MAVCGTFALVRDWTSWSSVPQDFRFVNSKPPGHSRISNVLGVGRGALRRASTRFLVVSSAATAVSSARRCCLHSALRACRDEDDDADQHGPRELWGENVLHEPVLQAVDDGHDDHRADAHDPAERSFEERASAHLLRDCEKLAAEVAEAVAESVDGVTGSNEEVEQEAVHSLVEIHVVCAIMEDRAHDEDRDDDPDLLLVFFNELEHGYSERGKRNGVKAPDCATGLRLLVSG